MFWYCSGDELHAVRQGDWKLHQPHEYLTVAGEPGKGVKPSNYGKLQPESIELSGIRGIAMRAVGLSSENLQAVTSVLDQVRKLQGLPPVGEDTE